MRSVAASADGTVLSLSIEGSVDSAVKAAARHEVVNLVSHEGDLEDAFLAFYSNSDGELDPDGGADAE